MEETVARLNIEHFRKKLAEERDEAKRSILLRLLTEEEAKLATILERKKHSEGASAETIGATAATNSDEPRLASASPR